MAAMNPVSCRVMSAVFYVAAAGKLPFLLGIRIAARIGTSNAGDSDGDHAGEFLGLGDDRGDGDEFRRGRLDLVECKIFDKRFDY